jgi:hypothetical protein
MAKPCRSLHPSWYGSSSERARCAGRTEMGRGEGGPSVKRTRLLLVLPAAAAAAAATLPAAAAAGTGDRPPTVCPVSAVVCGGRRGL